MSVSKTRIESYRFGPWLATIYDRGDDGDNLDRYKVELTKDRVYVSSSVHSKLSHAQRQARYWVADR